MAEENGDIDVVIIIKIRQTWTKLSDADLAHYKAARSSFIGILVSKYAFTHQQAEDALSNVERIARSRQVS